MTEAWILLSCKDTWLSKCIFSVAEELLAIAQTRRAIRYRKCTAETTASLWERMLLCLHRQVRAAELPLGRERAEKSSFREHMASGLILNRRRRSSYYHHRVSRHNSTLWKLTRGTKKRIKSKCSSDGTKTNASPLKIVTMKTTCPLPQSKATTISFNNGLRRHRTTCSSITNSIMTPLHFNKFATSAASITNSHRFFFNIHTTRCANWCQSWHPDANIHSRSSTNSAPTLPDRTGAPQ